MSNEIKWSLEKLWKNSVTSLSRLDDNDDENSDMLLSWT
jgi:hypothetical protein